MLEVHCSPLDAGKPTGGNPVSFIHRRPIGKSVSQGPPKDSATVTKLIELSHIAKWLVRGSPEVIALGNAFRRAKSATDIRIWDMTFDYAGATGRLTNITFATYKKTYTI